MRHNKVNDKFYFECPDCHTKYEVQFEHAEVKNNCPNCGKTITVPLPNNHTHQNQDAANGVSADVYTSPGICSSREKKFPRSKKNWIIFTIIIVIALIISSWLIKNQMFESNSTVSYDEITHLNNTTIVSSDQSCQIVIPEDWQVLTGLNENAIIKVGDPLTEEYLIIIPASESEFNGTFEAHAEKTSNDLLKSLKNGSKNRITNFKINEYEAIIYRIYGTVDRTKIVYLHTTIEGKKTFYQVIAWTPPFKFRDSINRFVSIINTFKEL